MIMMIAMGADCSRVGGRCITGGLERGGEAWAEHDLQLQLRLRLRLLLLRHAAVQEARAGEQ